MRMAMIHRFLVRSLLLTFLVAAGCGSQNSPAPECDSSQSEEVFTVTGAPGGLLMVCAESQRGGT